MALLAAYMVNEEAGERLEDYLDAKVFAGQQVSTQTPDPEEQAGFTQFLGRYTKALEVERTAAEQV